MNGSIRLRRAGSMETLEPRHLLSAVPLISEFSASNDTALEDGFGADPDWIELYNAGDESVDLLGYHLSDSQDDRTKWTFPESTVLEPGEFLLVFASSRDVQDPAGHWHTNFKLGAGGEYLALTSPAGSILSQFDPDADDYPAQFTDITYGLGGSELVNNQSLAEYWIPTNGNLGTNWTELGFDAAGNGFQLGRAALGFEDTSGVSSTSYQPFIRTELPTETISTYVRTSFELDDARLPDLSLNLLFDDGLVIYLNGQPIYTNQDSAPAWDSNSDKDRRDNFVLEGIDLQLDDHLDKLRVGENVLAFHMLNRNRTSSDFLLVPRLTTTRLSTSVGYLSEPTPGVANAGIIQLGPSIRDVAPQADPTTAEDSVVITAAVEPTLEALRESTVELHYRVMYGDTTTIRMSDNGIAPDEEADDGVFTAEIPGGIAEVGEMLRWFVTAEDIDSRSTRMPQFAVSNDSAEYFGTVIPDPTAATNVPVIHWFVSSESAAENRTGTRASLWMGGEFYDNVKVDLHGQSTAGSDFPKKSFDFDANSGNKFRVAEEFGRVSDFNLITNYGDQTKLRNSLGYGAHAESGGASHFTFPVSVHRNGQFFGLYDMVEQGDAEYLERLGRDPDGALYKVNNALNSSTSNVDKATRKHEGNDDLQDLIDGAAMPNSQGLVWDYDNLDIADMINYLAIQSVILNKDFGHKNMYWYLDTNGTQLWSILPWDVDLSFGHLWNSTDRYFDDTLITSGGLQAGSNAMMQRLYTDADLQSMYYRRVRSLMDDQFGAEGTPIEESRAYLRAAELATRLEDVAQQDFEKWGIHPGFSQSPREAADQLLDRFFSRRRIYLERLSLIPDVHGATADVTISTIDFEPIGGRADQQYVQFHNREDYAVDMSGWKLTGSMEHTFKPGTVIPSGGSLYLVVDPTAFKERTSGPGGGQKLLMQATTSGSFSKAFGQFTLSGADGTEISSEAFGSQPGDVNEDGFVNVQDVDRLRAAIRANDSDSVFDLNEDQTIDEADFDMLVDDIIGLKRGDANLDGNVDFADFLVISQHFGGRARGWAQGNFDADDEVTFADFLLLSGFFGTD